MHHLGCWTLIINGILKQIPPTNIGISTSLVIGINIRVLIIALLFSFVGISKFRKTEIVTELVGLDKELVIAKAKDFKRQNELLPIMDLHTFGIVVSFFDKRHGPIPIIVTPDILLDNYNLLVSLSDLSFSSARFSKNFENEIFSTYNFDSGVENYITIISFGFALDRPTARECAENITLNILIHKNANELLTQFVDKFKDKVHDIHIMMNRYGEDR